MTPITLEADQPTSHLVTITPELAASWLTLSPGNRDLRRWKINAYARDMRAGKWRIGEPVQFDRSGRLRNGHHRLEAVVQSETPIEAFVQTGLDDDIAEFVDTGVARTGGDAFKMAGYHQPKVVAAVATVGQAVEAGAMLRVNLYQAGGGSVRFTHAEDFAWAEANPDVQAAVDNFATPARKLVGMSQQAFVYAMMMLSREQPEAVKEFVDSTVNLRTNGRGDARHALLNYLQERRTLLTRKGADTERLSSMRAPEGLAVAFRAFNAWHNSARLLPPQLAPTNGELIPFPSIVPLPDTKQ